MNALALAFGWINLAIVQHGACLVLARDAFGPRRNPRTMRLLDALIANLERNILEAVGECTFFLPLVEVASGANKGQWFGVSMVLDGKPGGLLRRGSASEAVREQIHEEMVLAKARRIQRRRMRATKLGGAA